MSRDTQAGFDDGSVQADDGSLQADDGSVQARAADVRRGTVFGASAYLLWGVFPLYFHLLLPAGAIEILVHRVVWSLVLCLVVVAVLRDVGWVRPLLGSPRRLLRLAVAAGLIALNWGVYVYGVNSGQVVETSLGYFINPLVTVLLGVVLLRERLRRCSGWRSPSARSPSVC